MSLRDELATQTQLGPEVSKKIEAFQGGDNPGLLIEFVGNEVVAPLLAKQRDAILRLADEVDKLWNEVDKLPK